MNWNHNHAAYLFLKNYLSFKLRCLRSKMNFKGILQTLGMKDKPLSNNLISGSDNETEDKFAVKAKY